MVTACFDESRFATLLELAGQDTAAELTQRLDEDLTKVDMALKGALNAPDAVILHAQSHILMSIAGTIGATEVFDLAKGLNSRVRGGDVTGLAEVLTETRFALHEVIQRIRVARVTLAQA